MQLLKIAVLILILSGSLPARADTIVFAAASLTDVLNEIITTYKQETGRKVTASYASSSVLAKQIEAGAPAHIFISADMDWMGYLKDRGYIAGELHVLAGNRLVLIAPADSTMSIAIGKGMNLANALGNELMAIADPAVVPAGKYARAALEYYGEWEPLHGRIIPLDNVRAALMVVQQKEAPLGIVYATDARLNPKVRVVGVFPEESHAPIVYPAGLVAENRDAHAEVFFAWLQEATAKGLFAKFGFQVTP